jgi:hypothetical protein
MKLYKWMTDFIDYVFYRWRRAGVSAARVRLLEKEIKNLRIENQNLLRKLYKQDIYR